MRRTLLGLVLLLGCTTPTTDTVRLSSLITPAYVQGKYTCPQTNQMSVPVTFTSAVVAGDLIVAIVGWNDTTSTVTSVTDNRGNTYQLAIGPTKRTTQLTQSLYFAKNAVAGSTTVTAAFNKPAAFVDVRIAEYSGIDTANPLDTGRAANGNSSSYTVTIPTAAANELLVAGTITTQATHPSASWHERLYTDPDSDSLQDRLAATAGNYTANGSITPSGGWVVSVAAFRAATGGSSGSGGSGGSGGAGGSAGVGGSAGSAAGSGGSSAGSGGSAGAAGDGGSSGSGGAAGGSGGSAGSSGSGGSGGGAAGSGGTGGIFPLHNSADNHYLVTNSGAPFPVLGRTAWFLTSISSTAQHQFIDDSIAKGYSAFEFHVINHDSAGNNAPYGGNGSLPFLKTLDGSNWDGFLTSNCYPECAPDLTTPNEAYWTVVDDLLSYAKTNGVLALMFPAYVGYMGSDDGWMVELVANGDTRAQTYGAWIANRYASYGNIVWMMGGDSGTGNNSFNGAQESVEQALLAGLQSAGQTSFSAEWNSGSIATDEATMGTSMTVNGAYDWYGDVIGQGRRAYSYASTRPAFLLEEPYDEEGPDGTGVNPNSTQPVRRFPWWGWLSTTGGYVAGNGYVWRFNAGYTTHLNSVGSQDLAKLNAFVQSITWWQLVPEGLGGIGTLITAGAQSGAQQVTAAASPAGTLLVAYIPPDHTGSITVDMTKMSATSTAQWFNPSTGVYTTIGSFPNTGTHVFSPPGNNGSGFTDWVLVLAP